jgi:F-type H+-transporting ATPase subunit b
MIFDFDRTFVLQMLLFAGLIVVLRPLLFEPVLRVFEEREKRTEGLRESARQMQEEAGELLRRYDIELVREHEMVRQERERMHAETSRLEVELMAEARKKAKRLFNEGCEHIDKERQQIAFDLGRNSERLAHNILETVLGRPLH